MALYLILTILFIVYFVKYWAIKSQIHHKFFSSLNGSVDLELATTAQIIQELSKRPNNQCIILVPERKKESVHVNIHAVNLSVQMAMIMLRKTYESILEAMQHLEGDDDLEE